MNYWLILVPLISAGLGWIGAMVAGKILAQRIHAKRTILGDDLAGWSARHFSSLSIGQQLTKSDNMGKVMPVVESHIDDFLKNKLREKMPMIGMLIGERTVQTLKEIFLKEIEDMFPAVMQQFAGNLEGQVNFQKILAGKIADISVHQVKRALTPVTDYYALCTAAIGLAIGIVNVGIFLIL